MSGLTTLVLQILGGTVLAAFSFFLVYYLHTNFQELKNKTSELSNKVNQLENSFTSLKEKLDFVFKLLDDLEETDIEENFNSKIKQIEQSIGEISKEITQLDKNSIIRVRDLQGITDLVKDLSHDTEIKFREQDYHYASALEDIEQLKKKCEDYKEKIIKIEFQLNSLKQNLQKQTKDEI